MLELPSGVKKILHKIRCPNCQSPLKQGYIVAEGIRNSIVQKSKTAFFIEYNCPNCQQYSTLEITLMTVEDFVMEMIDQFAQDEDANDQNVKSSKSSQTTRISNEEFKNAVKMIHTCDNNIDFLSKIGMTPEDIDKYAFYAKKNIKNKGTDV